MPVRLVPLLAELARRFPDLVEAKATVEQGLVLVNGALITNPAARVDRGASIVVQRARELRGFDKLMRGLDQLDVVVAERTALDVGAAAGGFTQALLAHGVRRVYAVDVGHGQLAGSLRQDARVVNLEGTNVSELTPDLIPEPVDLVTIDVSYLSLAGAVAQLPAACLRRRADLVGLVKPMFELAAGRLPTADRELQQAAVVAADGIRTAGWDVVRCIESPVRGGKGAVEFFVHARLP